MKTSLSIKISMTMILLMALILVGLFSALYPLFAEIKAASNGGLSDAILLNIKQLFFSAGIGAFFVAAGLSLLLGRRIAKPLLEMESITSSLVQGRDYRQVHVSGKDELAMLGTGLNRLAEHLKFLESTRQEFLSHIAHELRTPLSYIRGYSQVIYEGIVDNEADQQAYLKIIHDESIRVSQLIEDLFALAQSDAGEMSVHMEQAEIDEIISTTVDHLAPIAAERNIRVSADLNAPGTYKLDPMRMRQVVMNLLDNALRYVEPSGNVVIESSVNATHLMVAVQNSGEPIPPKDIPYIFDRLYRVEKSRARQTGGSGLGLAIVKQIVELHGGTVTVTSTAEIGTRFVILLPLDMDIKARDHHA